MNTGFKVLATAIKAKAEALIPAVPIDNLMKSLVVLWGHDKAVV